MYVGPQTQRDYAYHQGTAWPWHLDFLYDNLQTRILWARLGDVILYRSAASGAVPMVKCWALLRKGLEGAPRTSYTTEIREFMD